MEAALHALLLTLCPRVYPDAAPAGTARPFIVWQQVGGQALRYADNTAPALRHRLVQVSVWTASRTEALALVRSVEDALCAATAFTARPSGESRSSAEPDIGFYESQQDFDIWGARAST